jgi:hypothetical protein
MIRKITTSFVLLALLMSLANESMAQRKKIRYALDYGFGLGLSNYLGEMGGKAKTRRDFIWDMKLSETRWCMGGFIRYRFNDWVAVHGSINYGRIEGDDALSTNRGRRGRNLHFRNDMLEMAVRGDLYLYNVNDVGHTGRYRLDFRSYVFAGIGATLHGPKAVYNAEWVKLRPLQTEGVSYGKITPVIPYGLGFYFTQRRKYRFGFEMGWRMTFTDYLDDVSGVYANPSDLSSQASIDLANRYVGGSDVPAPENYSPGNKRGDPTHNDTYFFMMFTYSYVWKGKNTFYTQNYGWMFGRKGRHRVVRVKF